MDGTGPRHNRRVQAPAPLRPGDVRPGPGADSGRPGLSDSGGVWVTPGKREGSKDVRPVKCRGPSMNRRSFLQQLSRNTALASIACGGARVLAAEAATGEAASGPAKGSAPLKITKVRPVLTAPQ